MNRYDKMVRNVGIGIFVLMLVTSIIFGSNQASSRSGSQNPMDNILQGMPLQRSTAGDTGDLRVGETYTLTISQQPGELIKNLTAKLSWTDESDPPGRPRIRRYENQPDTFSLRVILPDGNSSDDQTANPMGGTGLLEITGSLEDLYLIEVLNSNRAGEGNWTIEVSLVSTGMWTPVLGPGIIGLTDNANGFSLAVDYEYYDLESAEEG